MAFIHWSNILSSKNDFTVIERLIQFYFIYRPESADTAEFAVENGDVILVATDGVFDNVPENELITELKRAQGIRDTVKLQSIANSIAWMARTLSFDPQFNSPFAENARQIGIDVMGE